MRKTKVILILMLILFIFSSCNQGSDKNAPELLSTDAEFVDPSISESTRHLTIYYPGQSATIESAVSSFEKNYSSWVGT